MTNCIYALKSIGLRRIFIIGKICSRLCVGVLALQKKLTGGEKNRKICSYNKALLTRLWILQQFIDKVVTGFITRIIHWLVIEKVGLNHKLIAVNFNKKFNMYGTDWRVTNDFSHNWALLVSVDLIRGHQFNFLCPYMWDKTEPCFVWHILALVGRTVYSQSGRAWSLRLQKTSLKIKVY